MAQFTAGLIDVFADAAFGGNPLAVVELSVSTAGSSWRRSCATALAISAKPDATAS